MKHDEDRVFLLPILEALDPQPRGPSGEVAGAVRPPQAPAATVKA